MRKLSAAALCTLVYLVTLLIVYLCHVNFFPVDVVFYSALADAVIAALLSGAMLMATRAGSILTQFERWQLVAIWFLTGYAIAISVPTVIDRSLSFYILEKVQQRGGGVQLARFAEVFTVEYLNEHRLVDVRLTEQLESGTITIEDGCVRLTDRGALLASFSRFFRQHFLAKKRLLMGEYTDALTDPFRQSADVVDYRCQ